MNVRRRTLYQHKLLQLKNVTENYRHKESASASELLPLVYEELRNLAASKLARERPGQTLQATALVHEVFLKLVESGNATFDDQRHFFAAAAEGMRRLLIDRARKKNAQKHGGDWQRVQFALGDLVDLSTPDRLIAVSDALARFENEEPEAASLVKLCLFAGFPVEQAGTLLSMSRATAYRHWAYARAWLKTELGVDGD